MNTVKFCLSQEYSRKPLYYMLGTSDQFKDNGFGVEYVLTTEAEAEIKLVSDSYEANKQRWEAEIAALRERQPKCYACGAELDTYAKCVGCYDKLGAKRDALLERQRMLEEVIDKVLDKVKENEHFFKYFRSDIRVKDLVQSLFELEAAKDGGCGVSSAALAAKEG